MKQIVFDSLWEKKIYLKTLSKEDLHREEVISYLDNDKTSKTGNNPTWANAVETELGEKINKKREANLYGIEKKKGSYKRVTQPVDEAGEGGGEKSIDKMFMKLESKSQKNNVIAEEMSKMKNLIEYNRKTQ